MASPGFRRDIVAHHSLRGIAALLVVIYHVKDITYDKFAAVDGVTGFFSSGFLWVDLFFILSGFVLSYVYSASPPFLGTFSNNSHLRAFFIARLARVYPLHVVTLAMLVAIVAMESVWSSTPTGIFTGRYSPTALLANVFLVHGWGIFDYNTWNVPSWSISTEAFAYLFFPFLLWSSTAFPRRTNLAFLCLPIIFYGAILFNHDKVEQAYPILRCMGGFLLGMLAYNVWRYGEMLSVVPRGITQAVAAGGAVLSMHFHASNAITIFFFWLLVISTADDSGWLAALLKWRPLVWLGKISYSVYLIHYLLYDLYWDYGNLVFGQVASMYAPLKVSILKASLFLIGTLALANLSYHYVESPARDRFKRKR